MLVVAFTGQDGAGKSTQIDRLERLLRARGLSVATVHQYRAVTSGGDRLQSMGRGMLRRARSGLGGLVKPFAAAAYLGAALLRARRNARPRPRPDVLILDRWYLDEVLRVTHRLGRGTGLGLALLRLAPQPDIVFSLRVDPETGWTRKKTREDTLEGYRAKVAALDDLIARARPRGLQVIDIDGLDVDAVFERIRSAVEPRLP